MGYYYICDIGKKAFEANGPSTGGELSPELRVTMHSGQVAICAVPHGGAHAWRQTISTDEERIVREHGVFYVSHGDAAPPPAGSSWRSPHGYCQVVEAANAPDGGSYVLVRFRPATRTSD